jgi:hypothetical protein
MMGQQTIADKGYGVTNLKHKDIGNIVFSIAKIKRNGLGPDT